MSRFALTLLRGGMRALGVLLLPLLLAACAGKTGTSVSSSVGALVVQSAVTPATLNSAYTAKVTATGGAAPYTFTVASGSLPPGVSLSPDSGIISGTPTTTGSFDATIRVADSDTQPQVVSHPLSITVGSSTVTLITTSLPSATVGTPYSTTLAASGGVQPYTWTLVSGTLPAGLSLSPSGVISGTPTAATTASLTLRVTDASAPANAQQADFTLTVVPVGAQPLTLQANVPAAAVGVPYSATATASGGTAPYSFTLASGTLPAGLVLSGAGVVSGTPTVAGTSSFTLQVTDATNPQQRATQAVSFTVNAAQLTIGTTSLADASIGSSYHVSLAVSGGSAPYAWSIIAGTLPAGLSLSPAGVIAGAPTAPGTVTFTVQVTDNSNPRNLQVQVLMLTVRVPPPPALVVTTASLPAGTVGAPYAASLSAAGGAEPYHWSIAAGTLPAGLSVSPSGVISGTPGTAGAVSITVQVSDASKPANTATRVLMLTIHGSGLAVATATLASGTTGQAYSAALTATGGTAPYSWSVSAGALPAGLSLSAGGVISGTPSTAGTANLTVQVSDAASNTANRALSLVVNAPTLNLTTSTLPSGQINVGYSTTLSGSGGTTPYTWAISVGALPAGLTLSAASGVISGTPTAAGSSSFTVQLTDAGTPAQSRTRALTLTINPSALSVVTGSLPDGRVASGYSTSLAATGGTAPYSWSIASGSLPAGLSLSVAGVISGTPITAGSSSFTVQVTDATSGTPLSASAPLTLTIDPPPLTISTASLPAGMFGTAYSATLVAAGGTAPYVWRVASDFLPAGLSLSTDGVISGTPTAAGTNTFNVEVSDAQSPAVTAARSLSVTISPAGLAVTTATLPAGQVGAAYSASLAGTGGVSPYSWSLSSGALPAGLSLSASGDITGTPSAAGNSSFIVQLRDAQSPAATTSRALSINIGAASLAIATGSVPAATVGTFYSATLVATGGSAPYTWTLTSGSLPAGLALSNAGVISGTPTAAVNSSFTVQVSDAQSPASTASRSFTLLSSAMPLVVSTTALPSAAVNVAYSASLAASGGIAPYGWTLTAGSLPAGLSLSPAGVLSGTPTAAGSASITVQVSDAQTPAQSSSKALTLLVNPANLVISTGSLPDGAFGVAYSSALAASGGTTPYTWAVASGSLPAGLSLSSGGVLSGTPTAAGSSSFLIQVTDSSAPANSATRPYTVTINASALVINNNSPLPPGTAGVPYGATLSAGGGVAPYAWTLASGALPAGLALGSDGAIAGTPTAAGTASFTVQVGDAQSPAHNATKALTLTIAPAALSISTGTLPDGQLGNAYSATLAASGGSTPYAWSVAGGTLPAGLSLSGGGVLSGTPSSAGSSSFTLQVTDAQSPAATTTRSYTVVINAAALVITTASPLPSGQVGNAYSTALAASGGVPPYVWTLVGGALPAGLSLNASGAITGTPTVAGTASLTVQVQDSQSPAHNTTRAFTLDVSAAPLSITTASLSAGQVGTAYSATLAAAGGVAPYSWTLVAGALPAGLSLSAGGLISGTPTAFGSFALSVQVIDAQSPAHNTSKALTLTISPGPLSVATSTLPGGAAGAAYSASLTAAGGAGPYGWTIDSGALPAGLVLSGAGVISGTPSVAGSASFTVRVTDSQSPAVSATRSLSLVIAPAPLTVSSASLPNGAIGSAYSATLGASGGTAPYTWALAGGTLPGGLSLGTDGTLSGTPTKAVVASITVRVTDSQASPATATRVLTLTTTGSASLSWTVPDRYDDSTALTVRGYKIYYGTSAGSLGNVQQVPNPSALGDVVTGLTAGTWYFAVTAYDGNSVESNRTNNVSVAIP